MFCYIKSYIETDQPLTSSPFQEFDLSKSYNTHGTSPRYFINSSNRSQAAKPLSLKYVYFQEINI